MQPFRRLLAGLIFLAITILSAVLGYWWRGCGILDAIYMVVITIFGIGYGEFCPVSSATRIFTILVIIAGAISVSLILGGFVQMVTEGEIRQVLEHRRKTQDLANLEQHTIVCGFGRIGQVLSRNLIDEKQQFIVIDTNDERINLAETMGYRVYQGNATDEQTLLDVGIDRAKCLATVLPDDAINVFITLTARGLNPRLMIVARGELPSTEKKLRLAGADHVVLPATISGQRIANLITHPNMIEFLDQAEERARLNELLTQIDVQVDELTISINSPLAGKTIADLEVRGQGAFIVVALKRHSQITHHPPHDVQLHAGDTLIVLGHRGDIPKFAQRYAVKQIRYRGAQG
ncbi:potassium channel family protein [Leptolyngbya ohadii]|uniref:potassium channel family protein n=1 Tax=Leptolyngbya ohadii TaxID=1962290 RepID=UPI000B59982B|nr:potassium channel protein [Leptolyngbya ohadii]